jgi:hypothetical protein
MKSSYEPHYSTRMKELSTWSADDISSFARVLFAASLFGAPGNPLRSPDVTPLAERISGYLWMKSSRLQEHLTQFARLEQHLE